MSVSGESSDIEEKIMESKERRVTEKGEKMSSEFRVSKGGSETEKYR